MMAGFTKAAIALLGTVVIGSSSALAAEESDYWPITEWKTRSREIVRFSVGSVQWQVPIEAIATLKLVEPGRARSFSAEMFLPDYTILGNSRRPDYLSGKIGPRMMSIFAEKKPDGALTVAKWFERDRAAYGVEHHGHIARIPRQSEFSAYIFEGDRPVRKIECTKTCTILLNVGDISVRIFFAYHIEDWQKYDNDMIEIIDSLIAK